MERRDFLKNSCQLCAAALSFTALSTFLESCSNINILNKSISNNSIEVMFSELLEKDSFIVKSKGNEYDVALIKLKSGEWRALQMLCTHLSNPVFFNGDTFHCNVHFSEFSREGNPISGPAPKPLKILELEKKSDRYIIRLS